MTTTAASAFNALYLTSTDAAAHGAYVVRCRHARGEPLRPVLGYVRTGMRGGVECYLWSDSNASAHSRSAWRIIGPLASFSGLAEAAMSVVEPAPSAPVEPTASVIGAPAPPADVTAYEVDRAEAIHGLGQKSDAELRTLANHFRKAAPLAKLVSNRQSSEAIVAACERLIARRGAMVPHAVIETGPSGVPVVLHEADKEACEAWVRGRGNSGPDSRHSLSVVPVAPAMVPQPCQQQQAKAHRPARGERRYIEVRCERTGETFRVLTSLAAPGAAVIEFIPSNRHRQGELRGMLLTHDDITKAHVFADGGERNAYMVRARQMGGNPTYRPASIVADPAVR